MAKTQSPNLPNRFFVF